MSVEIKKTKINDLLDELETIDDKSLPPKKEEKKSLTEKERKQILFVDTKSEKENPNDFLKEKLDYLNNFKEDVETIFEDGQVLEYIDSYLDLFIVGETKNRKLVWLSLLDPLSKPTQIFVLGNSSIGKTHLVNNTLKLIPIWRIEKIGGLTENALKYKLYNLLSYIDLFYLQEYSGVSETSRQQTRFTSADDGGYKFCITVPDTECLGGFRTDDIPIRAMNFITTSARSIDIQDFTRAIPIYPDPSNEQSEKIVMNSFKIKSELHLIKDYSHQEKVCWAIYEKLRDLDLISIFPYDHEIVFNEGVFKYPKTNIRIRRDHKKIIQIAETLAKINYYHRAKFFIDLPVENNNPLTTSGLERKGFLLICLDDFVRAIELVQGDGKDGSLSDLNPTQAETLGVIEEFLKEKIESKDTEPYFLAREIYPKIQQANITESYDYLGIILKQLEGKGYLIIEKNPNNKTQNMYIYTYKKKDTYQIDNTLAVVAFNKWFEKQDQEVQDYLLTSDSLVNYHTTPSVSDYRNETTDSLKIEKNASRTVKMEKNASRTELDSDTCNIGSISDCRINENKTPVKPTNRVKSDIGVIGSENDLKSRKTSLEPLKERKSDFKGNSKQTRQSDIGVGSNSIKKDLEKNPDDVNFPKFEDSKEKFLDDLIRFYEQQNPKNYVFIGELVEAGRKEGLTQDFIERALKRKERDGEIFSPNKNYIRRIK